MWIWLGVGLALVACCALLLGLLVAASLEAMAGDLSELDAVVGAALAPPSNRIAAAVGS